MTQTFRTTRISVVNEGSAIPQTSYELLGCPRRFQERYMDITGLNTPQQSTPQQNSKAPSPAVTPKSQTPKSQDSPPPSHRNKLEPPTPPGQTRQSSCQSFEIYDCLCETPETRLKTPTDLFFPGYQPTSKKTVEIADSKSQLSQSEVQSPNIRIIPPNLDPPSPGLYMDPAFTVDLKESLQKISPSTLPKRDPNRSTQAEDRKGL